MSKIYENYKKFKEKNPETLAIYKIGIFFILIDEDAKIIAELTGLKLTRLNNEIQKCGFPIASLPKYTRILNQQNINYEILESSENYEKIKNEENYINNIAVKSIIEKLKSIDVYGISPREAINIIEGLQKEINNATTSSK